MPIISENSTSATKAEISAFFRMKGIAGSRAAGCESGADIVTPESDFFDFRPAEQAGRKEDQHHDQDREGGDVLVLDREISRPERLDQADQEPAQHRSGQRADTAEHRRGEGLDARDE